MPMPVEVSVYYTDGSVQLFYIPFNLMRGSKRFELNSNIKLSKLNEIMKLNKKYFNKNKACNVLSFPNNTFMKTGEYILGDIIICPNIVNKESAMYNKDIDSRWAHMVIHSMLHIQCYRHKLKKDKFLMEKKERELMSYLGYPDPYYAN